MKSVQHDTCAAAYIPFACFFGTGLVINYLNMYRGNACFLTYENKLHIRNKKEETKETKETQNAE